MLRAFRHAAVSLARGVRRLVLERDPVLLLGREGRWKWPWALGGAILAGLIIVALSLVVVTFETLAHQHQWIVGGFPQSVFPIDPAQPVTYLDLTLTSLPFLIAPLIVLPIAHGVSWRRAFSFGVGFQWRQFRCAALAFLCVAMLGSIVTWLVEPGQIQFPPRPPGFVVWVVLAIGVIFVQSFGEEVFFRGYLLRVSGAVLPYRLPVTGAVIALFVAGHLGNEDLGRDLLLNVAYFVAIEVISYALLFRTQNLAASAGLHWMNNVFALLAPTVPGQPTVLAVAIYTDPVYAAGGSRLLDPVTHAASLAAVALLLVLLLWRRSPLYLAPPARTQVEVQRPGEATPS
jgi:membrane protease YdiL (CAAX protease family)